MCEDSGRLIAWLDGEVLAEEAAAIERHLHACPDCRDRVGAYRRLSADVEAYGEMTMAAQVQRPGPRGLLVAATAAIAAAVVLIVFHPWPKGGEEPVRHAGVSASAAAAVEKNETALRENPSRQEPQAHEPRAVARGRVTRMRPRPLLPPAPPADAQWIPAEPAIAIAIPAEAVFPPGAVPEGITFNADLTVATDGSAQWLRLWP